MPTFSDAAPNNNSTLYRIGAVAKLSGVPVSTLRVWETRYAAFAPVKTTGQHRLYTPADTFRAGLLKQLTDAGHAISSIANLNSKALQDLQQTSHTSAMAVVPHRLAGNAVSIAVIGLGMASRIESQKFTLKFLSHSIQVTDVFLDINSARVAQLTAQPQILLIKLNTLDDEVRAQIGALVQAHQILQTIVIYHYGQETVVEALKLSGVTVRREPISDYELSDLISSVLLVDAAQLVDPAGAASLIPARKYSEQTLLRVAGISSSVLCECPRHVAELIAQLASFEDYSQECLNKSSEDAHLHAYLKSISGTARVLFERALEKVAAHEGISLKDDAAP